jgi:DNA damage-inducible protein 1
MHITVTTETGKIINLNVQPDEEIDDVKAILEVEINLPIAKQILLFDGKEVKSGTKLNQIGVKENDLLFLRKAPTQINPAAIKLPQNLIPPHLLQGQPLIPNTNPSPGGAKRPTPQLPANLIPPQLLQQVPQPVQPTIPSNIDPETFRNYVKSNPDMLTSLLGSDPELAEAVLSDDTQLLGDLLQERIRMRLQTQQQTQQQQRRAAQMNYSQADLMNPDVQRRIEEQIQQENINENMEKAIEYNPEAFGRVVMLYIDVDVNHVPVKAFVDSGAQQTIMSVECAERCGIMRLVDKRFAGIARGVGTARIVGRVHLAHLKIGKSFFPCSFTILEDSSMDFLLGLDMLRRHQCVMDLKQGVLKIGEETVPFLSEKDIPKSLRDEQPDETMQDVAPPNNNQNNNNNPSNTAQPASFPEAIIQELINLGFPRERCIEALKVCNGNPELAASYLTSNQ